MNLNKHFTINNFLLITLLFLGFFLRLFLLLNHEFSFDERFSFFFAQNSSFAEHFISPPDNRPPLYYSLVKMVSYISTSPNALRFPSLVFSILSLMILYKLFLLLNKQTALVALAIGTFHPILLTISWQARDYSLLGLLSLTSIYFALELLRQSYQKKLIVVKTVIVLTILALLGLLTSYLYYPFLLAIFFSLIQCIPLQMIKKIVRNKSLLLAISSSVIVLLIVGIYYFANGYSVIISHNQLNHTTDINEVKTSILELFSLTGLKTSLFPEIASELGLILIALTTLLGVVLTKNCTSLRQAMTKFIFYGGFILVLLYLAITYISPVSISFARGYTAVTGFSIGILAITFTSSTVWLKLKHLPFYFGRFLLVLMMALSMYYFQIVYQLIDVDDIHQPWVYPSISTKVMTALTRIVNSDTKSDQIIMLPSYENTALHYDWRNSSKFTYRFELHSQLYRNFPNTSVDPINPTIKDQLEIFFNSGKTKNKHFLVVVNLYVKNKLYLMRSMESEQFYALLIGLQPYCSEQTLQPPLLGSYEIYRCVYE